MRTTPSSRPSDLHIDARPLPRNYCFKHVDTFLPVIRSPSTRAPLANSTSSSSATLHQFTLLREVKLGFVHYVPFQRQATSRRHDSELSRVGSEDAPNALEGTIVRLLERTKRSPSFSFSLCLNQTWTMSKRRFSPFPHRPVVCFKSTFIPGHFTRISKLRYVLAFPNFLVSVTHSAANQRYKNQEPSQSGTSFHLTCCVPNPVLAYLFSLLKFKSFR